MQSEGRQGTVLIYQDNNSHIYYVCRVKDIQNLLNILSGDIIYGTLNLSDIPSDKNNITSEVSPHLEEISNDPGKIRQDIPI